MAAKRRHWKEKDGRFWARIAIPTALQPLLEGKTQLTEALGGDLRTADRNHAAAVARLQSKLHDARRLLTIPVQIISGGSESSFRSITSDDREQAVWDQYTFTLAQNAAKRAAMPTSKEIADEYELLMQRIEAGDADPHRNPIGMFNVYTDYELKAGARVYDEKNRTRRLAALRSAVTTGETKFVDETVQKIVDHNKLSVEFGSLEWQDLAQRIMRAQIQALERTLEQDRGIFDGSPTDPIIHPPSKQTANARPVLLEALFRDYIAQSQKTGTHRDGGANWEHVIHLNRPSFAGDQLVRVTRPYRVCSSLHRIPLQLRRVGCFRWVQAGGDG